MTDRISDLERALADEKQCARLNAECHTREIRALQDMVEAEAEARREAEGKVERLRAARLDLDRRIHNQRVALRENWEITEMRNRDHHRAAVRTRLLAAACKYRARADALEDELAGWKRVAVEAAIPLEAMRMSRLDQTFCPTLREGVIQAVATIRRAVMGEGLPPAPPPVPSSTKT